MKIKLVFDSTIALSQEEAKEYGIAITPFVINDNGNIYHDHIDIKPVEFYALWENNHFIKTSQPNLAETTELFIELLKEYDHIIYFTLPEQLSGTFATGKLVAKDVDESRITVIDCGTGVGAVRMMAKIGNKMIEEGKSVQEIVDYLSQTKHHSRLFVLPLQLEGLRVGGRLNNVTASIFGLVKIKICIYLTLAGFLEKFELARTESKIIKCIIDRVNKDIGKDNLKIYLVYSDDVAYLDSATKMVKEAFPDAEYEYMNLSPTLGAYTGPQTIALHFCKKSW